jgi:8-oxo-dGTP pyrophosphatase MutT (NUDIX family)
VFDTLTADPARGTLPDRFASVIDVHVILRRAGRVLLLRRVGNVYASGQFCLSGHMERGESLCQAAVRETFEFPVKATC